MPNLLVKDIILPHLATENDPELMEAIADVLEDFEEDWTLSDGVITYLHENETFYVSIDYDGCSVVIELEWNDETKDYIRTILLDD